MTRLVTWLRGWWSHQQTERVRRRDFPLFALDHEEQMRLDAEFRREIDA
jgi:hypothetical protein